MTTLFTTNTMNYNITLKEEDINVTGVYTIEL